MVYSMKKKLWRIPQQGKIKGVCAGLAHFLGVPVRLVRLIVVLSLIFGLFIFTVLTYFILGWWLDPMPEAIEAAERQPDTRRLLNQLSHQMQRDEENLRQIERYVTSETFSVSSRFRQL